ncbi:hypothetical protein FGB62_13g25 [Gracilaria domingensis]|nr:hypothetical protein FGB62_13g25 [Gracilaria domingensis]
MKLSSLGLDPMFERPKDLGLGKAICILPFCSPNMKQALGLLISAVVKASKVPTLLQLADRNSTHGLIDGMFYLIHRYLRNESSDREEYEASEDDVLSVAFCALNVVEILLCEEENRSKVVSNLGFRHAVGRFLGYEDSNRAFVMVTLNIVAKCCTLMIDLFAERDMDFFVSSLVKRLEVATGLDPEGDLESELEKEVEVPPDYEVSSKVLPILVTLARKLGIKSRNCARLIELCVRMLHCQERIADNTSLALMVHIIAERFPNMISSNKDLVRGVLKLIRDPTCVDIASETLIVINRTLPVRELVLESGLFSGWEQCGAGKDAPLTHLVETVSDQVLPELGLFAMGEKESEFAFGANFVKRSATHCADEGATVADAMLGGDERGDEERSVDTPMQEGATDLVQLES